MFAYCNNSPAYNLDSSGKRMVCARTAMDGGFLNYVIYYSHPESQANLDNNAKQNHSSVGSRFVAVSSFDELVNAINNTPGYVDDVFVYLHGDDEDLSFYHNLNYSAEDIQENLLEIKIYGDIHLFSCKGGRGALASTMANATNCTVVASEYKVSFGNGFARCGWENYFWDIWNYGAHSWYSFYPDGSKSPLSYFWILTQ